MCNCNECEDVQQYSKQDEFWNQLITKYEQNNIHLENNKQLLQECVNQMEAWMPPYLSYKMFQLNKNNPHENINKILHLPCDCSDLNKSQSLTKQIGPNNLSSFTLDEVDINFMKTVRNLSNRESDLVNQVNRLRKKDKILKDVKLKVDRMLAGGEATPKVQLDGNKIKQFQERFQQGNELLEEELFGLRKELSELRAKTLEMEADLEKEKDKGKKLKGELASKTDVHEEPPRRIATLRDKIRRKARELDKEVEENCHLKRQLQMLWQQNDILIKEFRDKRNLDLYEELNEEEVRHNTTK